MKENFQKLNNSVSFVISAPFSRRDQNELFIVIIIWSHYSSLSIGLEQWVLVFKLVYWEGFQKSSAAPLLDLGSTREGG